MSQGLSGALLYLEGFIAAGNSQNAVTDAARRLVGTQPLLLEETELRLAADTVRAARAEQADVDAAVGVLLELRDHLLRDPLDYPLGPGPLERLWESVWGGGITLEYGRVRAAEETGCCLTDVYALAVSAYARRSAHSGGVGDGRCRLNNCFWHLWRRNHRKRHSRGSRRPDGSPKGNGSRSPVLSSASCLALRSTGRRSTPADVFCRERLPRP
ncbi:hypothetical protein [Streptomyces sp. YIM B13518]|uniref:hypothetical protein n=1 Tax=Streptomyces sp. YIM B13518 TaxID=3366316 RepID=UPI0036A5DE69